MVEWKPDLEEEMEIRKTISKYLIEKYRLNKDKREPLYYTISKKMTKVKEPLKKIIPIGQSTSITSKSDIIGYFHILVACRQDTRIYIDLPYEIFKYLTISNAVLNKI